MASGDGRSCNESLSFDRKWGRGFVRAIDLNARDLAYLRALFIFGVLSNEMLHALVCAERGRRVTTDRMFLLKNQPNDYVVQPKGQENSKSANYASLSYEISRRGVEALVDSGLIAFSDFVLWRKLQANYKPSISTTTSPPAISSPRSNSARDRRVYGSFRRSKFSTGLNARPRRETHPIPSQSRMTPAENNGISSPTRSSASSIPAAHVSSRSKPTWEPSNFATTR